MISRRDFLKYCSLSAAALGLSSMDLFRLQQALANPNAPTVLWLQGSSCTGCSISFLNRISSVAPKTVADVLVSSVNLVFHPNIMAAAGESAVSALEQAYSKGGYVFAVEGGIPTAFQGNACYAWSKGGTEVTFQDAVKQLSSKAVKILSIGTCASWGGIPAAPPNVAGIQGVGMLTGRATINIAGCPPHPDWIVWAISQILLNKTIALDSVGRPKALYGVSTVHEKCPRREREEADFFGVEGLCLKELGCRGPKTRANCPSIQWNGGVNWCVGANGLCIGCTEANFPGTAFVGEHDGGVESEEHDD